VAMVNVDGSSLQVNSQDGGQVNWMHSTMAVGMMTAPFTLHLLLPTPA